MPRYYSASDGCSVEDFLHCGFDHLSAAQKLLSGNAQHFDSAGYVAHLAFELLLKGWHLHSSTKFLGIHKIEQLWNDIRKSTGIRQFSRRDLGTLRLLDTYGDLRYPNLNNPIEIGSDDLPKIIELAKSLYKRMPKPLHEIISDLHWSRKGGRIIMERSIARRHKVGP